MLFYVKISYKGKIMISEYRIKVEIIVLIFFFIIDNFRTSTGETKTIIQLKYNFKQIKMYP